MNLEQKTITSVEVAEMVGKDHSKLLRDIRTYYDQLNQSKIGHVDFFTESTYVDTKGESRPCYNVTKKGCEFIGNKLTGIKGTEFTARYINRFHEMEAIVMKPLSEKDMLRIQLNMIDEVEQRVENLENNMVIDYGQQQVLKNVVNATVTVSLGGKSSPAYKEISKIVFSECNKDFQNYFKVNSRNNTPKIKFDEAINYVSEWQPCTNTKLLINNCNAQLTIAV